MKKTVLHSMLKRFAMVAQEADLQNKAVLAASLTNQIDKYADNVRSNDEGYHYDEDELMADLKDSMWDALVRLADFYQTDVDEEFMEKLALETAESLKEEFCSHSGAVVGAYEEQVPGEEVDVEIDDA